MVAGLVGWNVNLMQTKKKKKKKKRRRRRRRISKVHPSSAAKKC
jgi:hypothetical protein